jgi:hypothetical protein
LCQNLKSIGEEVSEREGYEQTHSYIFIYIDNGKGMLDFIFDCRHYELVVRGLNITVMKDKLMVNLRTFLWHPKVGIIGSREEISSRSRSVERQVKNSFKRTHTHTHKHYTVYVSTSSCWFYLILNHLHPN